MTQQKERHIDDPAAVGRRLREARERSGLSQNALANGACTPAYISRIELGERVPSLQLLEQLGRRLAVSAHFLATGLVSGEVEDTPLIDAEVALRLDDPEGARRLFEQALSDGASGSTRAAALAGLGRIALREGHHHDAIDLLTDALEASGHDAVESPEVAESLARAYASAGEFGPAIALLDRCVERYERSGDVLQYIRFASLLGYALTDNGDFARAERVVAGALSRGHDVTDPYARARLYWSQARLLAEQGKPGSAERYARKTLETLRATEDSYAIAHAIETLAHICLELGRSREALELLDEGDALIRGSASPPELAHYELERARALAALGDHEQAASLAMRVAGQMDEVQPVSRGRAYLLLAQLFAELGDVERAQELFELAIDFAEGQAPGKHLVSAYRGLAEILKARGDRDAALTLLERALAIQERGVHATR
jgi:tetratricopeptide (TPR) repeat protein